MLVNIQLINNCLYIFWDSIFSVINSVLIKYSILTQRIKQFVFIVCYCNFLINPNQEYVSPLCFVICKANVLGNKRYSIFKNSIGSLFKWFLKFFHVNTYGTPCNLHYILFNPIPVPNYNMHIFMIVFRQDRTFFKVKLYSEE